MQMSHDRSPRAPRPRIVALAAVLAGALFAPAALAQPAAAATVYELAGAWASSTPAQVGSGDPLSSTWRFNLNDDAAAPGNALVPDVTIVFTAANARFTAMPDTCLDAGNPASAISDDRRVLTCNVGARPEGSAEIVLPGIVTHGPAGSEVGLQAQVADQTASLPLIPIVGDFAMDFRLDSGSPELTFAEGQRRLLVPWSLRHAVGPDAGPAVVDYDIDVEFGDPALVAGMPTQGGVQIDGCIPQDRVQPEYPYSGTGHPADRTAAFPGCELQVVGTNLLRLTLTGLTYGGPAPASDSRGVALPTEWDVIAAGQIMIQFPHPAGGASGITVTASTPTYVSTPGGAISTDDPANNENHATIVTGEWYGGWSLDWMIPPGIGHFWSDTFRTMAGEEVLASSGTATQADGTVIVCSIYDVRYVEYRDAAVGWLPDDSHIPDPYPGVEYEYYVGDAGGFMDPDDPAYDPNEFRCGAPDAGWVSTPSGADEVRAVRATTTPATVEAAGEYINLFSQLRIRDDVTVGQDVWFWTSVSNDGGATWIEDHRGDVIDPAWMGSATATPDARYAFAYAGRDVLRIVPALPVITKTVDQPIAAVGAVVDYTITAIPEAPLDAVNPLMTVVDTLPPGVEYVAGSAFPEPVVSGNELTWSFPDGATNEPVVILFSAKLSDTASPGDIVTNTATATIDGLTREASAATRVQAGGFTSVRKTVDAGVVPQVDGVAENTWTVRLESHDSTTQAFTDTIDVLPYVGDSRGTSFTGTYVLAGPVDVSGMPAGTDVYYATAAPGGISDDPADPSNGAAGDPSASAIWSTDFDPEATAVRVVGPALPPSAAHAFAVSITTTDASPGDRYVNRAQARAGNTALVMRTSSAFTIEPVDGPAPSTPPAPAGGGSASGLSETGLDLGPIPLIGAALLVAGAVLLVLRRRRGARGDR